jgi:hypothetical protein
MRSAPAHAARARLRLQPRPCPSARPAPLPQVKYGQSLRVVGNLPALGGWDTARGLDLRWSEGHVWAGTLEVDVGAKVEFKVRRLVLGRAGAGRCGRAKSGSREPT